MYTFFRDFLRYPRLSLRLPHKLHDGYGIKTHHIDDIAASGAKLLITVDNGITALQEASYAKKAGIDMIITDHHQPLAELPDAYVIINPHLSPEFSFPDICGAAVAFKVCMALADHFFSDRTQKKELFNKLLPFVSIATVADCMPLIHENRLLVKKGLELMNTQRWNLAPSLRAMLDYLGIDTVDTFHIGFMIAPRLNATGRMDNALEGLKSLLFTDPDQLQTQLAFMDGLNTKRKEAQETMFKHALDQVNEDDKIIIAADESYHEGIIGIVAGKLTEKFYKPSLVLGIDHQKGLATGSLRAPSYFNIVQMLQDAHDLLERYGGHAQAGGLTVKIENIALLRTRLQEYCATTISDQDVDKEIIVDTKMYDDDLHEKTITQVAELGPFGEGNPEPLFLVEDLLIYQADTVGKNGSKHLKLQARKGDRSIQIMQRRRGDNLDQIIKHVPISLCGRIKKDSYKGGIYIEASHLIGS